MYQAATELITYDGAAVEDVDALGEFPIRPLLLNALVVLDCKAQPIPPMTCARKRSSCAIRLSA